MSIITRLGKDVIKISEENIYDVSDINHKVHLIRLDFKKPKNEIMKWVITTFPQTNRYIIDNEHIRFYNYFFKRTNLKYYVINTNKYYTGLISFFKRNNKVLLDTTILNKNDIKFVFDNLIDVLSNTEVIIINNNNYNNNIDVLKEWKGNIILYDNNDYVI